MKLSPEAARLELKRVSHARFEKAIERNWVMLSSDQPAAKSILWLYCWAKTGMGSQNAAGDAQTAFDSIFDKSYDWFDRKIDHAWAQRARYRNDWALDAELQSFLDK